MKDRNIRISKFLSLVLRHRPEEVGIMLDRAGWVAVSALLQAFAAHGSQLTLAELQAVVRTNDKQRFSFSPDGLSIRASQGHSLAAELGYESVQPPPVLYHGTASRFLPSIRREGLAKGRRQQVHLSAQPATAHEVGRRYGQPVVLNIASAAMHRDEHLFFRAANGVWLTAHVPARYITFGHEDGRR